MIFQPNINKLSLKKLHPCKRLGWLVVLVFFISFSTAAQNRQALEKQRIKLQKEIKTINALLFSSQTKEKNLLSDLSDLNKRITVREELIATINKETKQLSKEISKNEKQIGLYQQNLKNLKDDYANMVVQSYKSKTQQSRLMFILSSDNFLQAYKRMEYIKQYASYRAQQGEEIKKETLILQKLNDTLKESKSEKETLLLINKGEKEQINQEKETQETLVAEIKKTEKKYISQIKQKQKEEKKIDKKIEKLIREAIARSKKKAKNKANYKSSGFALTPESKLLEKDFISNKGKLPSPVERGVVIRRFGTQAHPTLSGITIESNGIHYATEKNANARVIFNGKVLAIQILPGKKKAVLIQHGNYISVYKNLDNVTVKKGDLVTTKQKIGKIHTDKITGKTVLAFVLFKETVRQNPEKWVYKI